MNPVQLLKPMVKSPNAEDVKSGEAEPQHLASETGAAQEFANLLGAGEPEADPRTRSALAGSGGQKPGSAHAAYGPVRSGEDNLQDRAAPVQADQTMSAAGHQLPIWQPMSEGSQAPKPPRMAAENGIPQGKKPASERPITTGEFLGAPASSHTENGSGIGTEPGKTPPLSAVSHAGAAGIAGVDGPSAEDKAATLPAPRSVDSVEQAGASRNVTIFSDIIPRSDSLSLRSRVGQSIAGEEVLGDLPGRVSSNFPPTGSILDSSEPVAAPKAGEGSLSAVAGVAGQERGRLQANENASHPISSRRGDPAMAAQGDTDAKVGGLNGNAAASRPVSLAHTEAITAAVDPMATSDDQPTIAGRSADATKADPPSLSMTEAAVGRGTQVAGAKTQTATEPLLASFERAISIELANSGDLPDGEPIGAGLEGQSESRAVGARADPSVTSDARVKLIVPQIVQIMQGAVAGEIELQLNPEELGRIRMSLSFQDGGAQLTIQSDRSDTADLLRRHGDLLRAELEDLGYVQVDISFANGSGGDRSADQHDAIPVAEALHAAPTPPFGPGPDRPQQAGTGRLNLRL